MKEPNKRQTKIVIEFTEKEYKDLIEANSYTCLNANSFLRILIQEALNQNLRKKNAQFVTLKFSLSSENMQPEEIKVKKWVEIGPKDFKELSHFSKYTGMKNSALVKLWIMPMCKKIIAKKGWEVNI